MSEGSNSTSPLMASLFSMKVLVKYGANFVTISALGIHVLGKEDFITASGYMVSAALKTSRPYGFPL
jgi:hypothetical protein